MFGKFYNLFRNPESFLKEINTEGHKEPFVFLLVVALILSPLTALMHIMGLPSTDISASLQSQIIAWRATEHYLAPRFGYWAFLIEIPLIILLVLLFAGLLTGFIHMLYKLMGGKGSMLNAWKAVCYGVAPCVFLGFIPYWSLFVASWSLILQFYFIPKTLYCIGEGRALFLLALIIALTLFEFATMRTTVNFGPR